MPLRNLPIRSKLALMFVGVCLVTFALGGYLVSSSAKQALQSEIMGRLDFQSRAYAVALDAYLQMLTRRSEDFASDGYIRDGMEALLTGAGDAEATRDDLRAHLLDNKLPLAAAFTDLTLLTPEGEVLLAAYESPPPAFTRSAAAGVASGAPWFSSLLPDDGPEGHPRLAIGTPIHSRSRPDQIGVLVAWVHPGIWIVDALRSIDDRLAGELERVALQLGDGRGTVLKVHKELTDPSGPSADSELVRSGFGLELAADDGGSLRPLEVGAGHDIFRRSYPIAANGWPVGVELHGEDILSAVAGLQSRFVALGIVLSVLACLLFLLPMRFFTRPLLDLTAAARRLAGGDSATRVVVNTDDEIGALAGAFNSMAAAVEERTQRLQRTAVDLRERQGELGAERDRLRAVISSMRDGLVVLDADGEAVVHNRAAGPLLKQLKTQSASVSAYHVCEEAESLSTGCSTCLFSPSVGPRSCVVEIDGGVYEIHAAKLAADASGRSGRVLVCHDLSDRIEQDERHIHQERLAVLGEVAAVMAHELNNPLAAISMYNQMLAAELAELDEGPRFDESIQVIQRNVASCKQTIRELLNYATNTTPEIDVVDVNATLEDVSTFLRPLRERSHVDLRMDLPEEALEVTGDEVQIRQVFVNLIVNAIQAVGEDGGWVSVEATTEDGYALVDVRDNGPGITNAVRDKIFRPFYTTKARGEGTGLGLPTARRIAEMHGGGLDLIDGSGGESVFRVRLRLQPVSAA